MVFRTVLEPLKTNIVIICFIVLVVTCANFEQNKSQQKIATFLKYINLNSITKNCIMLTAVMENENKSFL